MPHQCVRCNTFYDDGSKEILTGCKCGSRLFFFVKKEALKKAKEMTVDLTPTDRKQIEKDVFDLIGKPNEDTPVVLDLESIKVCKPGKFELDLVRLFDKKNPLVYKLEDGKYMIDVAQTFQRRNDLDENDKK